MKLSGIVCVLCGVFLISNAIAAITEEGSSAQKSLSEGKKCMATWSSESSKEGQETEIFAVRELDGKTQYYVSYSNEYPKIWTWDFRLMGIKCE